MGGEPGLGRRRRQGPEPAVELLRRPRLRLLLRRPQRPHLIDEIGEDNITYESDYPHSDSTWPRTREIAEKQMAGLTDEQRYKVVRGNAIKLFGLDFK